MKKQTVKPTKHPRAECRIFEVNLKLQALMQKPILHKICLLLMKIIIGAINWNVVFQQLWRVEPFACANCFKIRTTCKNASILSWFISCIWFYLVYSNRSTCYNFFMIWKFQWFKTLRYNGGKHFLLNISLIVSMTKF